MKKLIFLAGKANFIFVLLFLSIQSFSQNNTVKKEEATYTVEYYYKVKWGFADEFIGLFKKNHLPILKKQMQLGRILSLKAETPVYHGTEDGRWDYRVTITWKSAATTFDGFDEDAIKKELYPDEATFKKEEQRRFEILLAHWDLPVKPVEINN